MSSIPTILSDIYQIYSVLIIFLTLAGYIIGLGAVTVIDSLGFLGRKSSYWTETTIRAHKVTKPLIWLGITLRVLGEFLLSRSVDIPNMLFVISTILILNGIVLSFYISPKLLELEKVGKAKDLLPQSLQNIIMVSFVISFIGWWSSVVILSLFFYVEILLNIPVEIMF